jgi:aspartate aminotransferase-like enzyme
MRLFVLLIRAKEISDGFSRQKFVSHNTHSGLHTRIKGMLKKVRLFTPGPTPLLPAAQFAMAAADVHHRTAEFRALYQRVLAQVKDFVGTKHDVIILSSSGTGAMEAAVSNLTSPGDRVLVLSAGKFGERWSSLGKAFGCQVETLSAPYGQTFSMEDVRAHLKPDVKVVFMQATETSTGARHCVQSVAALTRESNALLVVDAITGLGTTHFDVDAWGIDVIIGGSQKAVMIPPGLSYCAVSERAWQRMETSKNPRYYFDLRKERKSAAAGESAYTPAVALIAALGAALDYIAAGAGGDIKAGRDALIHNAEVVAEMTRAAAQALGLKLFAPDAPAAAVTAILAPEGTDSGKIVKGFKEQFGGVIANGQGEMKGQLFRIAHLGFFDYLDTIAMVGGLEQVLQSILGCNLLGVGLKAAQDVYANRRGTTLAQLLETDRRCSCGQPAEECSSSLTAVSA